MCISNCFPTPIENQACGWGQVIVRSAPLVGIIITALQYKKDCLAFETKNLSFGNLQIRSTQYLKCARLACIISLISGVALIIFAGLAGIVTGSIFLGLALMSLILSARLKIDLINGHVVPVHIQEQILPNLASNVISNKQIREMDMEKLSLLEWQRIFAFNNKKINEARIRLLSPKQISCCIKYLNTHFLSRCLSNEQIKKLDIEKLSDTERFCLFQTDDEEKNRERIQLFSGKQLDACQNFTPTSLKYLSNQQIKELDVEKFCYAKFHYIFETNDEEKNRERVQLLSAKQVKSCFQCFSLQSVKYLSTEQISELNEKQLNRFHLYRGINLKHPNLNEQNFFEGNFEDWFSRFGFSFKSHAPPSHRKPSIPQLPELIFPAENSEDVKYLNEGQLEGLSNLKYAYSLGKQLISSPEDIHKFFGLKSGFTEKSINKKFRELALKIHPDKQAAQFKEQTEALFKWMAGVRGYLLEKL